MCKIHLTKGYTTVVDQDTFDLLLRLRKRCRASVNPNGDVYAMLTIDGKDVYLHRWILGTPPNKHTDHVNGKTLDNHRTNLRVVTHAQNLHNQTKPTRASSGYRGVSSVVDSTSWRAYVNSGNGQVQLGCYTSPEAAAIVRDAYVREHHPTAPANFERGERPMTLRQARAEKVEKPVSKTGVPNIREKDGFFEVWIRIGGRKKYAGRTSTLRRAKQLQREVTEGAR